MIAFHVFANSLHMSQNVASLIEDGGDVKVLGFMSHQQQMSHGDTGPRFKVSSERLDKSGIQLTSPGLLAEEFMKYRTQYVCYLSGFQGPLFCQKVIARHQ